MHKMFQTELTFCHYRVNFFYFLYTYVPNISLWIHMEIQTNDMSLQCYRVAIAGIFQYFYDTASTEARIKR